MSGSIVQFRPTIGYDYEELVVTNAVQVLTPAKYKDSATSGGASAAFITNDGDALRYTYDNVTTPSATVGHKLADGGILVLNGQNQMAAFKCFRVTSDTTIRITFERE